ncbi:PD-(D/E)XK nuclease family protein [Brachyspira suanatina]|uniref:PD-(D/E)XK nuclease family protein n=1 Tax=Brachyspira suanatina TaxID=381802 RepID=UPI00065E1AA7|nr:PD-(D/E)XK nuclease family protein [Brachyspira suanatina]
MENIEMLNILNVFLKEKNNIINHLKEERKKRIPKFNIIEVCSGNEVDNSKLLAEMLKIDFIIDNKEINLAKDFSNYIIKEKLKHNDISINNDINVDTEVMTKYGRRIDLLIYNDDFEIIIENKINANELENQLEDYYNDRLENNYVNENKLFIVFLSKYGQKSHSLSDELKSKLEENNRICYLSHNDISDFIDNIFVEYPFLKDDKYISVYSALIQMRDNERNISNNKIQENNMEKNTVIEKFFSENGIYESLNKIDDIEECSKLFSDSAYLIKSRKIQLSPIKEQIEIINNTIKYLKDNGLQNENCRYLDEEIFKGNIINNKDANSTPIIININNNLTIKLFISKKTCYLTIFSNSSNIINKLNEITMKEEIIKIFGKYELREGKNDPEPDDYLYVYYFLIGQNDDYKEIGSIIINLYNYLKDQSF